MRRMRERRKAAGLRPITRWVPAVPHFAMPAAYSNHRLHDIRSLALHTLIAAKIEGNRSLLAVARRNLKRWRLRFRGAPARWWQEWDHLLNRSWPELAALLTDPGEEATRLRQSSPFAGVLTATERRKIYDAFRA
jgi:hypothetical protein